MSRRFPPVQMVTLDRYREPVRAGYVMKGLYGGFCRCGYFVTFERRESVLDCPRCRQRFTTEEAMTPWLESRRRTTTTPSSTPPNSGRPSPPRWSGTQPAPTPTVERRRNNAVTTTPPETPPGDPRPEPEDEVAEHHEEEEREEEGEES